MQNRGQHGPNADEETRGPRRDIRNPNNRIDRLIGRKVDMVDRVDIVASNKGKYVSLIRVKDIKVVFVERESCGRLW